MKPVIKRIYFASLEDNRFRAKTTWGDIHATFCKLILFASMATLAYALLPNGLVTLIIGTMIFVFAIIAILDNFSHYVVFCEQFLIIFSRPKKFPELRYRYFSKSSDVNMSDVAWMKTKELFESYP